MALFDFFCEKCGKTVERIIRDGTDSILCDCGGVLVKQFPRTFNFYLKYDPKRDKVSWGNEGYATTQRYKEYDKQAKKNIFPVKK